MKKVFFLLMAFFLFFSTNLYAENKTIIAACDPWAPFVDPEHPGEGISMEIIRSAYKTQGYSVKLEYVPWARAMQGVKTGKYDILPPAWKTAEREKFLMFSDAYAVNQIKFIKRKDDSFEYNGIESLKGKTVGIMRGYGYGDDFNKAKNFQKQEVARFELNIKKLVAGRIDLTLEDEIVARVKIAKNNPELLEKVDFTENALSSNDLYIAAGLENPRHKEIISAFNKGLKQIKSNGEYNAIMKKYGVKK